jgi:BASS family bile acid:Na+ symporter
MDKGFLLLLVQVTLFANMLAIGLSHTRGDLVSLWRDPSLLLRSLLVVVILFPLATFAVIAILGLPLVTAAALAILAAAPGAPMTYKRSRMAGANARYVASLQLSLAVLAVVVTPMVLVGFDAALDLGVRGVGMAQVAGQIALVQLLPVTLGLLSVRFAGARVPRLVRYVTRTADVLLVVMVLVVLVPFLRLALAAVGGGAILGMVVLAVAALAMGHALGGPPTQQRAGLAISCVARNLGLAIFIVMLLGLETEVLPVIAAFAVIGAIIAVPYSIWTKRAAASSGGGVAQRMP